MRREEVVRALRINSYVQYIGQDGRAAEQFKELLSEQPLAPAGIISDVTRDMVDAALIAK